jgi:hypothetical protein
MTAKNNKMNHIALRLCSIQANTKPTVFPQFHLEKEYFINQKRNYIYLLEEDILGLDGTLEKALSILKK